MLYAFSYQATLELLRFALRTGRCMSSPPLFLDDISNQRLEQFITQVINDTIRRGVKVN